MAASSMGLHYVRKFLLMMILNMVPCNFNQLILVCPNGAVESQFLEALQAWMRRNHLQLNPNKTECLWILGPPGSKDFPFILLDQVALLHS